MGEAAKNSSKKDAHDKRVIAGRVTAKVQEELYRRAAADRRPFAQWLELVLEEYLLTHPAKPTLVADPIPGNER